MLNNVHLPKYLRSDPPQAVRSAGGGQQLVQRGRKTRRTGLRCARQRSAGWPPDPRRQTRRADLPAQRVSSPPSPSIRSTASLVPCVPTAAHAAARRRGTVRRRATNATGYNRTTRTTTITIHTLYTRGSAVTQSDASGGAAGRADEAVLVGSRSRISQPSCEMSDVQVHQ